MIWKVAILFSIVALAQATGFKSKDENTKAMREYVDINGTTFFVDTFSGYYRDEAKTLCDSLNMTMVTMDNVDKWQNILIWLEDNHYETNWFWTSAMRDVNSTRWYWESTGSDITEFYWKLGQPSMDEQLVRTCINFSQVGGGWDDDECRKWYLDAMCEAV